MAGGKRPFDEDDDMASLYLRRMRGDEAPDATTPASRVPSPPPLPKPPGPTFPEGSPNIIDAPVAPRFPGAPPSGAAPAAFAFGVPVREPLPGAPPETTRAQSELPPGAPALSNPKLTVNPGDLPVWMASEGLQMLRQGDYTGAAEYYEAEAKRDPARAEGWLGIGAALVGSGDFQAGVIYLLKGVEIDGTFPVGTLISESKPGHPQLLLNMAELFMAARTQVSTRAALDVLDECMRSPLTPQKIYLRANELRQDCRDLAEALKSPDLSKLKGRKIRPRRGPLAGLGRTLVTLLVLGGLAYGGWFGWRLFQGLRYARQGFSDYKEAYQMASTGMATSREATDPIDMYYRAFIDFKQAQVYKGTADFQVQFMLVKCGEATIERARENLTAARKLSPASLAEIEATVRQARTRLAKLDPSGAKLKEQQAKLSASLQTK